MKSADQRRAVFLRVIRLASSFGIVLLLLDAGATLVRRPVFGAPDHGDFWRVANPAGIRAAKPPKDAAGRPLVRRELPIRGGAKLGTHTTSASLIAALGKHARFGLSDDPGSLDVRQLGVTYLALLAALCGLAVLAGLPSPLCLLLTWIAVDPSYIGLFNSLYTEPPLLVALFGIALWLLYWREQPARAFRFEGARSWILAGALIVLMGLAGFSRLAACLVPLSVVLVIVAFAGVFREPWTFPDRRKERVAAGFVALGVAACVVLPPLHFAHANRGLEAINKYNVVFQGVAAVSDDPRGLLDAIEVPPEYATRVGKSYFDEPVSPELAQALERVSRWKVAWCYLSDPTTFGRAVARLASSLVVSRSSLRYEDEHAANRHEAFWGMPKLRRATFGLWPPSALLFLSGAAVLIVRARRLPVFAGVCAALGFLLVTVLSQLAITLLGDGFYAAGRHLVPARLAFDLLVGICVYAAAVRAFASRFGA